LWKSVVDRLPNLTPWCAVYSSGQVSRTSPPPRPNPQQRRDLDPVKGGGPLRRVETLAVGSGGDRAAPDRPRVDRPASDGDDSDDGPSMVGGGKPGPLKRWPAAGDEGVVAAEKGKTRDEDSDETDDDETSDDDEEEDLTTKNDDDDDEKQTTSRHVTASLQQSTSTATPEDSQADSLLVPPPGGDVADVDSHTGGNTTVIRATVI